MVYDGNSVKYSCHTMVIQLNTHAIQW